MPLESMCGAPSCARHVREDPENSEVLVIPVWDWGRGGGGVTRKFVRKDHGECLLGMWEGMFVFLKSCGKGVGAHVW